MRGYAVTVEKLPHYLSPTLGWHTLTQPIPERTYISRTHVLYARRIIPFVQTITILLLVQHFFATHVVTSICTELKLRTSPQVQGGRTQATPLLSAEVMNEVAFNLQGTRYRVRIAALREFPESLLSNLVFDIMPCSQGESDENVPKSKVCSLVDMILGKLYACTTSLDEGDFPVRKGSLSTICTTF